MGAMVQGVLGLLLVSLGVAEGKAGFCHLFYVAAGDDLEVYQTRDVTEVLYVDRASSYTALLYLGRSLTTEGEAGAVLPNLYQDDGTPVRQKVTDTMYAEMRDSPTNVPANGWYIQRTVGRPSPVAKATILEFIQWAVPRCSPDQYKVITFNMHGTGFAGMYEISGQDLPLHTLSEIFGQLALLGIRFDLVGFDACLMSSYAVAKALGPYADYLLASEAIEPVYGWKYAAIDTHAANPVEYGTSIIDAFMTQPAGPNILVLTNLQRFEIFLPVFTALVEKLAAGLSSGDMTLKVAIERARENAVSYKGAWDLYQEHFGGDSFEGAEVERSQMDLWSFLNNLHGQCLGLSEIPDAISKLADAVLYRRTGSGAEVACTGTGCSDASTGMAIWFKKRRWVLAAQEWLAQNSYGTREAVIDAMGPVGQKKLDEQLRGSVPTWYTFLAAYYLWQDASVCDPDTGVVCQGEGRLCPDTTGVSMCSEGKCLCLGGLCARAGFCSADNSEKPATVCNGAAPGVGVPHLPSVAPAASPWVACYDRTFDGAMCMSMSVQYHSETGLTTVELPSSGSYGSRWNGVIRVKGPSTVQFTRFQLESSTDCFSDYLIVNGQKHCGSNMPALFAVDSDEGAYLTFVTDTSVTASGFAFMVQAKSAAPPVSTTLTPSGSTQSANANEYVPLPAVPCWPEIPFCSISFEQHGQTISLKGRAASWVGYIDLHVGLHIYHDQQRHFIWSLKVPMRFPNSTSFRSQWSKVTPVFVALDTDCNGYAEVIAGDINSPGGLLSLISPARYYRDLAGYAAGKSFDAILEQQVNQSTGEPASSLQLRTLASDGVEEMVVPKSQGGFVTPLPRVLRQSAVLGADLCIDGPPFDWATDLSLHLQKLGTQETQQSSVSAYLTLEGPSIGQPAKPMITGPSAGSVLATASSVSLPASAYGPNQQITIRILPPVEVVWESFDVEPALEKDGTSICVYDWIQIRVGDAEPNRYCGTSFPPRIEAINSTIMVDWSTDATKEFQGWSFAMHDISSAAQSRRLFELSAATSNPTHTLIFEAETGRFVGATGDLDFPHAAQEAAIPRASIAVHEKVEERSLMEWLVSRDSIIFWLICSAALVGIVCILCCCICGTFFRSRTWKHRAEDANQRWLAGIRVTADAAAKQRREQRQRMALHRASRSVPVLPTVQPVRPMPYAPVRT